MYPTAQSVFCYYADHSIPVFSKTHRRDTCACHVYHQHWDGDWEIQYVTEGASTFRVGDTRYQLQAGELLIIDPDQPHVCETGWGTRRSVTFRPSCLRRSPFGFRPASHGGIDVADRHLPTHMTVDEHANTLLQPVLDHLQEESLGRDSTSPAMCTALLGEFLIILAREAREVLASAEPVSLLDAQRMIGHFCRVLRDNLAHDWTQQEMARRSGYSSRQLCRLFHQVTTMSPGQWLREERLHRAGELLAQTDLAITDVALEVGINDRCHFHRLFRRSTGLTPEQYRELIHSEPVHMS